MGLGVSYERGTPIGCSYGYPNRFRTMDTHHARVLEERGNRVWQRVWRRKLTFESMSLQERLTFGYRFQGSGVAPCWRRRPACRWRCPSTRRPCARFRSKVDGFVPQQQNVNLVIGRARNLKTTARHALIVKRAESPPHRRGREDSRCPRLDHGR